MNRLTKKIASLKKLKQKALVTYVTAGYPDIRSTGKIFSALAEGGADIIELGVPFSDPIADGPTIQFASDAALKKGISLRAIFTLVRKLRRKFDTPIILMGYLNPIIKHGIERTAVDAKKCGVDGFIIPDTIPEESEALRKSFSQKGISLIYLLAPNTPPTRMKYLAAKSSGFVYLVSLTGVTGGRKKLPDNVIEYLKITKRLIRKPRFVGFGISTPAQAAALKEYVDGVIVGSAVIDIIRKAPGSGARDRRLKIFAGSLKKAIA